MEGKRVEKEKPLDERWFRALVGIRPPLLLNEMSVGEGERQLFHRFVKNGDTPRIVISDTSISRIRSALGQCVALQEKIIQEENSNSITTLYVKKLEEEIAVARLLLALSEGDTKTYNLMTETLFGETDLTAMRNFYDTHSMKNVSEALFERARKVFPLPTMPQIEETRLNAESIAKKWNEILASEGFMSRAVVSKRHHRVSVIGRDKSIYIPDKLSASRKKVLSLFAHEFGVHIKRRSAGRRSNLRLLGIGTGGVSQAEEGLALMAEQVSINSRYYRGRDKYRALLVAMGAVDGQPKNFTATFYALKDIFYQRFLKRYETEKAEELSLRYAWTHTRSIFRVPNPDQAGTYFTRGKLYFEGCVGMWDFLKDHDDQDFLQLFKGRFSPGDLPYLKDLGVIV